MNYEKGTEPIQVMNFHCNKEGCGKSLGVFDSKRVLDHLEWHKIMDNIGKQKKGKK